MEHPSVKTKDKTVHVEVKLELYKTGYKLIWEELVKLKECLGLDPVKIVTEEQYSQLSAFKK